MKILINDVIIECEYKDFEKVYEFLIKPVDLRPKQPKKENNVGRKPSVGSVLTKTDKELIKKITIQYPERSDSGIAKELTKYLNKPITKGQVHYWRKHGNT